MTKYYYKTKRKVAFTLTELVVAVIFLFFVSLIVSKEAVKVTKKRADVEKIQSTYHLIEKAAAVWQNDNDCNEDIKLCINKARKKGIKNNEIFNGVAKYLPVMSATVPINAKGREIRPENIEKVDWLPAYTKNFDGIVQENSQIGVSKYNDGKRKDHAFYKLRDGVTLMVNFSDNSTDSAYGFFDINGIEGENTIGVDVFPFSFGSDISQAKDLYSVAAMKFNPYFSHSTFESYDLCNINLQTCNSERLISNPTAYVLKWNKLPK